MFLFSLLQMVCIDSILTIINVNPKMDSIDVIAFAIDIEELIIRAKKTISLI